MRKTQEIKLFLFRRFILVFRIRRFILFFSYRLYVLTNKLRNMYRISDFDRILMKVYSPVEFLVKINIVKNFICTFIL